MFSCFARDLSKVSARSVPELESSITKSFSGVKVAWLRSVVNYWAARASRWIPAVALSQCYSFELTLRDARPVMRTKDEMSQEEWLPLGGLQFAKPVLGPRVQSVAPTAFSRTLSLLLPCIRLTLFAHTLHLTSPACDCSARLSGSRMRRLVQRTNGGSAF